MTDDEIVTKFDKGLREAANQATKNAALVASLMGYPDVALHILKLLVPSERT